MALDAAESGVAGLLRRADRLGRENKVLRPVRSLIESDPGSLVASVRPG